MGKPKDPDYWRKWRAAHPEYKERERARLKARKAAGALGKGDTRAQRSRRRDRLIVQRGDNGWTETSHAVMDDAQRVAIKYIRPDHRTHYHDPLYEEALMVAALAILEGADPDEAVQRCLRSERAYRALHLPMLPGLQ